MPIFHKFIWFFSILMKIYNILWLKILNGSVKQHAFYLAKNSSAHSNPFYVSLNANELCSPHLSLLWGDEPFSCYCLL